MAFIRRAAHNFLEWKGMSDRGKVVLVAGGIFALAGYQVMSSTRVGGDAALSNEKPESLRGEAKHSLAEGKAKAAAPAAAAAAATAAATATSGAGNGSSGSAPLR